MACIDFRFNRQKNVDLFEKLLEFSFRVFLGSLIKKTTDTATLLEQFLTQTFLKIKQIQQNTSF